MQNLSLGIISYFVSKAWTSLLAFILVPVYINILGVENYGLIGFFTTFSTVLLILDLGLSSTLNRQLACRSNENKDTFNQLDLIRTLEIIYWITASVVGFFIIIAAPFISRYWLKAQTLSHESVAGAVSMMGIVFIFQFPSALYQGGLMGIQKHIRLNLSLLLIATIRGLGVIAVLLWISNSLNAFFIWQMICSGIQAFLLRYLLWDEFKHSGFKPKFNFNSLENVWKFAAGMTSITVVSVILSNADKLLLSKIIPLKEFGYYMIAASAASSVSILTAPFFNVAFPKLSQLITTGSIEISHLYHTLCQALSCAVFPFTMVIIVFSREILNIWTHNNEVVRNSNVAVSFLVASTMINAAFNIPYSLILANGWTIFPFIQNIISIFALFPILIFLTHKFGTSGAAISLFVINLLIFTISPHIMHKRLLNREKWKWYLNDTIIPLSGIISIVLLGRYFFDISTYSLLFKSLFLSLIWLSALITGVLLAPNIRRNILNRLHPFLDIKKLFRT